MFSNFTETTSIRINGVDPEKEVADNAAAARALIEGSKEGPVLKPGEILIPTLLARGMKVKAGDTVVLVATNRDGSVNGKTFTVRGIMESVSGPSGRDGYIHIDDARDLLQNEGAARSAKSPSASRIPRNSISVYAQLSQELSGHCRQRAGKAGRPATWLQARAADPGLRCTPGRTCRHSQTSRA